MRTLLVRVLPLAGVCLYLAGCSTTSTKPLPKYEKPLARTAVQSVRTTAYTHTEADHLEYSNKNALGTTLQYGPIHSAAADWSRWPAGTMFRIRETGELYIVDDYGWALSGTNTIDLYKPTRSAMNSWGVRHVTIENLQWGDPRRCLSILRTRSKYRHIQRMIKEMEDRSSELAQAGPTVGNDPTIAMGSTPPVNSTPAAIPATHPNPIAMAKPVSAMEAFRMAQPPTYQQQTAKAYPTSSSSREPFYSSSNR